MADMLQAARDFANAGYSVIPAKLDGSKAPLAIGGSWKQWQSNRANNGQLEAWFSGGHEGIGIVTGEISGNLEMLELEGRAVHEGLLGELTRKAQSSGLVHLLNRIMSGYLEQSPSGGIHMFYRLNDKPRGNQKLASRPATDEELTEHERTELQHTGHYPARTLIETRGEGGFVVTAPSHGRTHPTGRPWAVLAGHPANVAHVDDQEHAALLDLCRSLNTYSHPVLDTVPTRYQPPAPDGELSPGDDYNGRGSWEELLSAAGWRVWRRQGSAVLWTRPGKDHGPSAISGGDRGDYLYVFSTSVGLPTQTGLSKYRVYALLNCAGDFSRAASELRRQGYGTPHTPGDGYRGSAEELADRAMFKPTRLTQPGSGAQVGSNSGSTDTVTDEWFWTARPELDHVRRFARARKVGPYAVLGHVLTRVISAIGHQVKLPPIIGGRGSLNLFAAIVARPGEGKDGAHDTAEDCVNVIDVADEESIGSGEGVAAAFVKPAPQRKPPKNASPEELLTFNADKPVWRRHAVIFQISEVSTVASLAARNGSTLIPELCKAYAGQRLGFANRAIDTRLPVPKHEYRACLVMNVQPGKADILLDYADTGFPQRFWFINTDDPGYQRGRPTEPPNPITWKCPDELHPGKMGNPTDIMIEVCDSVVDEIIDNYDRVKLGDPSGIAGHHYFTQLKVAAGLAVFDGRLEVGEEDWKLASHLMSMSARILDKLHSDRQVRIAASNIAKGEAEAQREVAKVRRVEDATMARISKKLLEKIKANGDDGITSSELRKTLASRDRQFFDNSLQGLITANLVTTEQASNRNGIEGLILRVA